MKISAVQSCNPSIQKQPKQKSFKSYLSPQVVNEVRKTYANSTNLPQYLNSIKSYNAFMKGLDKISYNQIIDELYQKFGITTDLKNNKVLAGMNALTCNVFQKLGLIKPPSLFVRDFRLAPEHYKDAAAVTAVHFRPSDFDAALKEKFPFRSVIYNSNQDWDNIQLALIQAKESGHLSSGHFLSVPLHEYFHNAHADNVFRRYGNIVDGDNVFSVMQKNFKNPNNINLVSKETSNYATTSPAETFAEEMTERIADSLNIKTILPDKNPFTFMPFQGPMELTQLIDDVWKGNFLKKY